MDFIIQNWAGIVAIFLAIIRVIESIMVVWKNDKVISILKVVKEFFKLS